MTVDPPLRPHAVSTTRFDQHDVVVDGLRIRYVDVGPTADQVAEVDQTVETIVVLPGHTARIEGFDELVTVLAARRRVVVPDFPGSGYSDKPDRSYTLAFYEDVLVAFLDALGIGTAIPLGGSLGGNLVLRLGHRFPERFPRLVLWAPGGAWTSKGWLAALVRRTCGRRLFWPTVRIQSRYWYDDAFAGKQAALDETFAYYREVMCPGFVRMYWGIAADQLGNSLFDIAPKIDQPTLLCWGDHDNGAGMGAGVARLHELLPDNTFHVFEGARHSLETEIPAELGRVVNDFLDGSTHPDA